MEPRQFRDGVVLWSDYGTDDVGACQISVHYWGGKSMEMGLDIINSIEDNITMAKYIYDEDENGLTPWKWSESCWGTD